MCWRGVRACWIQSLEKRCKGNRYKVHRILTPEGKAFALPEMTNAEPNTVGTVTSGSQSLGGSAPAISSASETDAAITVNPSPGVGRSTAFASGTSIREDGGAVKQDFSQELDIDKLSKENARLRARVERLKGETKLTKEKTVRQADVDKLARQIVKDYSSTIDASEISGELKAVGDSIVQGGEHMTYEALMDKLKPIADKVVKNAQVLNDQQYQEYKELRDELRTANMTLGEANRNDLMGYDSFLTYPVPAAGMLLLCLSIPRNFNGDFSKRCQGVSGKARRSKREKREKSGTDVPLFHYEY